MRHPQNHEHDLGEQLMIGRFVRDEQQRGREQPAQPEGRGGVVQREVLRVFKFALDLTPAQAEVLARHAGAARWAFNYTPGRKAAAHRQWRAVVEALVEAGVPEAEARRRVKACEGRPLR
ncbi:hypothetical protein CTZ27_22385 [Streptomyces griseocarneus]|nr:hypothetical protein CTZ27_22385 [Streptomyces griseocarneus]